MTFPVVFHPFGLPLPAHAVFELAGYTLGFQLYLLLRRRSPAQRVPIEQNMWVIVGCVFGALVGSKLLALIESPIDYWNMRADPRAFVGGKTIVGGLLGGWIGVEIAKRKLAVHRSTGDLFVFPLILGMILGRIGCFLTGLPDHTYGTHSTLPWAVNFGDGPRHPTQLYEAIFLLLFGIALWMMRPTIERTARSGALFRLYLGGYLCFRFLIEFIKPRFNPYLGLSAIQIASLIGAIVCIVQLLSTRERQKDPSESLPAAEAAGPMQNLVGPAASDFDELSRVAAGKHDRY
jgi:prolipoprotein diacylglyceryltransferase